MGDPAVKVTISGLVLFGVILAACLAGTQSLETRKEAAYQRVRAIEEDVKRIESSPEWEQLEQTRSFVKGVVEWRKLKVWFLAHASEQRKRLAATSGSVNWPREVEHP